MLPIFRGVHRPQSRPVRLAVDVPEAVLGSSRVIISFQIVVDMNAICTDKLATDAEIQHAPVPGIGRALGLEIESYAERLRHSHPLMDLARRGQISRESALIYLRNILYMLRQTPINLRLACDVCAEKGMHNLASFYREKLNEEMGHDSWAEHDILCIDPNADLTSTFTVVSPLLELDTSLKAGIKRDPFGFMAYILFVEYFTVLLGPEWVGLLTQHCGVPAMTSISRHAELDKDHVEQDMRALDLMHCDEGCFAGLQTMLHTSMTCWERFFDRLASSPS